MKVSACLRTYISLLLIFTVPIIAKTQFPDKIVLGFGGGINSSLITETEPVTLYENLSGEIRDETYTGYIMNIGNQYFFHIDFYFNDNFVFALKPGTYSYRFLRISNIILGNETIEQETHFRLRYFNVPLEIKYKFSGVTIRPFLGFSGSYGLLQQQADGLDESIIVTKITAAPIGGFYYDLNSFSINIATGYNFGLHNITRKGDRYAYNSNGLFSQSDIRLNDLFITLSILFSLEKSRLSKTLECVMPKR